MSKEETIQYDESASMGSEPDWIKANGKAVAETSACFLLGGDTEMAHLVAYRFAKMIEHAASKQSSGQ